MRQWPNRHRTLVITLLVVAGVLAATHKPFAYVMYGWKWQDGQAEYYINPANLDVTPDAAIAAIQSGAAAWTNQTAAPFGFYYMGTTTGNTIANNGRNEVFFRNESNGAAIATTYYWSSGTTALDADIVFWDGAYKFFTGSSGCSGGFYIEDVATHEFGHALGLAHSPVTDATMVSGTAYCGTYKRSLATDDQAGAEAVYTSVAPPPPPPVSVILSATTSLGKKGSQRVSLVWTSGVWTSSSIYRNGALVVTTSGSTYTDLPGGKGTASYTYHVCSAGTTTCSNDVRVTF
jgi:hypothetical protein